ncbi:MAG: hypothetical protein OQK50_07840 [Deltaproteobacteria bacterium]|nr:hypothetical protein [Deltaproteobacteria bacterium]MCW8893875.1 hypothetical protein [Deltaproteobacteria bacterium]MCW9050225.1 hypothetical protein [Deltaproteobacteria bacterium]
MKTVILLLCFILPLSAIASDGYDNKYCKDPVELQKWAKMLSNNPDSDEYAALHALWVGLCVQVEMHNLTTERANKIFEDFRWGIIESIKAQEEEVPDKSPM